MYTRSISKFYDQVQFNQFSADANHPSNSSPRLENKKMFSWDLPDCRIGLQQVDGNGLLETHVLGTLDGQPVPRVVVNHLGDGQEPAFEITELEITIDRIPANPHVHVTARTPAKKTNDFNFNLKCKNDKLPEWVFSGNLNWFIPFVRDIRYCRGKN